MNYDLEAQEGKIYPHSRAFVFDFWLHFKFQVNYEVNPTDSSAGTIPCLWQEFSQTNTYSRVG
jgi:hypothetical protein